MDQRNDERSSAVGIGVYVVGMGDSLEGKAAGKERQRQEKSKKGNLLVEIDGEGRGRKGKKEISYDSMFFSKA